MSNPFFTIGHSTRPTEEFVALLKGADVELVVDVRTVPRSRTNPQFNRDVPPAANAFWENASFHNFADYAMSEGFRSASETYASLGAPRPPRSCARKASGGGAFAASLRIIS
jgi:uncharacterized protein DUF488